MVFVGRCAPIGGRANPGAIFLEQLLSLMRGWVPETSLFEGAAIWADGTNGMRVKKVMDPLLWRR
jgi:hypothetical protein